MQDNRVAFCALRRSQMQKSGILISIRRTGDGFHPRVIHTTAFSGANYFYGVL